MNTAVHPVRSTGTVINPIDVALTNTVAVLPDRLLDDATIVVRDGVIVEVAAGISPPPGAIDCHGSLCMPGAVDTHSDGLEKELRPRPGVLLPMDFALHSFEGRVRGAGVTTIFHGVGFDSSAKYERSISQAEEMCAVITERAASGAAPIDHYVLHRLDVRDPEGLDALQRYIPLAAATASGPLLVSYEDHTPGVGQYADRAHFEQYVAGSRGLDADGARQVIDELIEDRERRRAYREIAVPWLAGQASRGIVRLMCHDPASADEIAEAVAYSATIAEFPTTVEAAHAARSSGLRTMCGGPNALRGISHSGNVSARDLIAAGLCDGLASDYLPSTLLGSVGTLTHHGICDLPTAVRLITSGPAATVGLGDRGRLEPGPRGDLAVFDLDGALPTVRLVISQAARIGR